MIACGATLSGCGGSAAEKRTAPPPTRFEQHGFQITFDYPQAMKSTTKLVFGATAGSTDTGRAAVGIDRDNVILVTRYDLRRPVTGANIGAVKPEVDGVIRRLVGHPVDGARMDAGGLPGYRYRVALGAPEGGVSRLFVLFDRKVEYFFNCQSTPESRATIDNACNLALRTLQPLKPL